MIGAVLAPTPPVQGFISGDQFVCSGLSVNIGLQEYSGFIQWQESPDGLTNWANVSGGSGSNSATYITPSLNVTTYYRVEVTQPTFAPVYSNVTTVQVLPSPGEAGPITGDEFICQGRAMSCTSLKKLQMQPPMFGPYPSEPPVPVTPIVFLSTLVQHLQVVKSA